MSRSDEQEGGADKAESEREQPVVKVGQPHASGEADSHESHDGAQGKEREWCPCSGTGLGAHDRNHGTRTTFRRPGFSLFLGFQG